MKCGPAKAQELNCASMSSIVCFNLHATRKSFSGKPRFLHSTIMASTLSTSFDSTTSFKSECTALILPRIVKAWPWIQKVKRMTLRTTSTQDRCRKTLAYSTVFIYLYLHATCSVQAFAEGTSRICKNSTSLNSTIIWSQKTPQRRAPYTRGPGTIDISLSDKHCTGELQKFGSNVCPGPLQMPEQAGHKFCTPHCKQCQLCHFTENQPERGLEEGPSRWLANESKIFTLKISTAPTSPTVLNGLVEVLKVQALPCGFELVHQKQDFLLTLQGLMKILWRHPFALTLGDNALQGWQFPWQDSTVQLAQELLKFIQGLLGFVDATVREASFLACLDGFSKPLNVTPTPLFRKVPHQFVYFVSRCHSCGDNFMLHPNCLVNVFLLILTNRKKISVGGIPNTKEHLWSGD